MTLKQAPAPASDQPSVSQFFKRKTPPPRSSSTSPHAANAASSLTSAKRVKVEHAPAGSPSDKRKGRAEVIVLDSDGSGESVAWQMAADESDDEVQMISASVATARSKPPAFTVVARPGLTASTPPSGEARTQQQQLASGSRTVQSSVTSTSGSARSAAPVAPIFQQAQQAAQARPSAASAASKRPAFNAKESAAAQALRVLSYVEPVSDLDDVDASGAGPSTTVSQAPPVSAAESAAAKAKRHEQFAAKLLGRRFGRRRSLDLDEAEARAGHGSDDDAAAGGSSDADARERVDDESADDSTSLERPNAKLSALKSTLTAPVKKKETGGKKKASPEVGPSGQTYTPLEEQVRAKPPTCVDLPTDASLDSS